MKKQVLIYLDAAKHKRLKQKALDENTDVTKLVNEAIDLILG